MVSSLWVNRSLNPIGTKRGFCASEHNIEKIDETLLLSEDHDPHNVQKQSHKQSYEIFYLSQLFEDWKNDMSKIVTEGVGGLMDLSVSLEKMISHEKRLQEDQHIPMLHRASVVGLFLRRIILCFDKLNFSEVSHLYHNFKKYYEQGKLWR